MNKTLNAVIFDMDGVITNTMPYHYRVWKKIFHDEGISVSKFQVYKREGQKGIESLREIFALHHKPFCDKYGQALLAKKEKILKNIVKTRFVPGACLFLKKMKKNGFRLALVTGTSRHEVEQILPKDIYHLFDVVICGSDVKKGKPHPEPYLKAIKALKIKRGEAFVVENAPLGIASAKKAGLRCLALKTSLPAKYLKEADAVFNGFASLERYVHGQYCF
ncbi:MAG: HAD family phosphatase [Candidatus Omnitrophica bacterium]|nr:HAD family phosphatase [Candidatus Omnitrophota bacterium]